VDGRIESEEQSASLRFVRPPNAQGWVESAGVHYVRTDLNNLLTKTVGASVRRASIEDRDQWQFGGSFLDDQQRPLGGEESTAHALYVDIERIWRRVDSFVAPTTGWIFDLQAGAGVPGVSTRGFGRVVARSAAWYPVSSDWQLSGKAEGGVVFGASRQEVPSTLLFRTGGDTTVRGYAFESLGVTEGQATVPGRYYVVGSVEATRWINATWGIATFVDAGNAFDDIRDFKIALGYGVGARVRTPIGPFRFDVAYGQDSRQVRVHFFGGPHILTTMATPPDPPSPIAAPPGAPKRRRRVRGVHLSLGVAVLIVMALTGSVAFLLSEAGLPFRHRARDRTVRRPPRRRRTVRVARAHDAFSLARCGAGTSRW